MKLTDEWISNPEGKFREVMDKAKTDYEWAAISLEERDEIGSQAAEYKKAAIKERARRRMEES